MNEPAMTFDGVVLSPQKEVVRVFFKEMWDKADKSLIPKIFHPDVTFRGSLGPVLRGHEEFTAYYDSVTGAISEFTSFWIWWRKVTRSAASYAIEDTTAGNFWVISRPDGLCGGTRALSSNSP